MAKQARHEGVIITPNAIASYPHLVEARTSTNGTLKRDICLVFQDPKELKGMQAIALGLLKEQFGENAASMVKSGKLHWPFRPVDEEDVEKRGWPEGGMYMNVGKNDKFGPVGVVSRVKDPKTGKPTVIDPSAIYAGCIVKASLDCFTFEQPQKKGVTFGLRNVQFIEDGDRLDGISAVKAEDEGFEADLEQEDADLSDLEAGGEDESGATEDAEDDLADLLS